MCDSSRYSPSVTLSCGYPDPDHRCAQPCAESKVHLDVEITNQTRLREHARTCEGLGAARSEYELAAVRHDPEITGVLPPAPVEAGAIEGVVQRCGAYRAGECTCRNRRDERCGESHDERVADRQGTLQSGPREVASAEPADGSGERYCMRCLSGSQGAIGAGNAVGDCSGHQRSGKQRDPESHALA